MIPPRQALAFVALVLAAASGCGVPQPTEDEADSSAARSALPEVAVLRNSRVTGGRAEAVEACVARVTAALKSAGVRFRVLTDEELEAGGLDGFALAILPDNAAPGAAGEAEIVDFLARGGRAVVFGRLPRRVTDLVGVRPLWDRPGQSEGEFGEIRFRAGALPGARSFRQASPGVKLAESGPGAAVAAEWASATGEATGVPAVIASRRGVYVSDVLRTGDAAGAGAFLRAALEHLARAQPPKVEIALWRNTHAERADREGDGGQVGRYLDHLRAALLAAGLPYEVVSDEEVAAGALERFRLAIQPLTPSVPAEALVALKAFRARGGRLLVFYAQAPGVAELLGVRAGGLVKRTARREFLRVAITDGWPEGPSAALARDVAFFQGSYHAREVELGPGAVPVAAWLDRDGKRSRIPAVVLTPAGLYMTHALLPGDTEAKARFLLAAAVHFLGPGSARAPAEQALERVFDLGRARSVDDLAHRAGSAPEATAVKARTAFAHALAGRQHAAGLLASGDAAGACAAAFEARAEAARSLCLSFPSRAKELRGVWLHSMHCEDWDALMERLAAAHLNALFVNACSSAYADYPSAILPPSRTLKERGDQLAKALAAGRRRGVEVHVWMCCFFLMRAQKDQVARLKEDGRLALRRDGSVDGAKRGRAFLCPSDARNRKRIADAMVEITERYHPDGIHFDYIRYPGGRACFCERCRSLFAKAAGREALDWSELDRDEALRERFVQWRCDQVTPVVEEVARRSRAIDPKVRISAAVFPLIANCRTQIGQDWVRWAEQGWLDFVCPMDYTDETPWFGRLVEKQHRWIAGRVPLYPGIACGWRKPAADVAEQAQLAREKGADGFVFFELEPRFLERAVPALKLGVLRSKAAPR